MRSYLMRFGDLMIGTILFSVGIVFTMKANLGYAPWEVFHQGLGQSIGLSIGNASIISSVVISLELKSKSAKNYCRNITHSSLHELRALVVNN